VGYSPFDRFELGLAEDKEVPEISVDLGVVSNSLTYSEEDGLLTVINSSQLVKSFYLTLLDACINEEEEELEMGEAVDEKGKKVHRRFLLASEKRYLASLSCCL
jgi:hypothetical protein